MSLSKFGKRFTEHSGIVQLMDDLCEAMANQDSVLMLGGGNPAHIPAVQQFFQERMQRLAIDSVEFAHTIGEYALPQGDMRFINALVNFFHRNYGWKISSENIALTAGSQSAFFLLFNMFAGEYSEGINKKILLPMTPEYIGYSDVGLSEQCLTTCRPVIDILEGHVFKYRLDLENLTIDSDISAMCVSRPTNPTGNVLTDTEIDNLYKMAKASNIPLIIDNAYGMPFPNIVFTEVSIYWDENIILCMSLSKLGLPGTRTGIVIARPEIIASIAKMNAIFNLALGSFGPALALDLVNSDEILSVCNNVIQPYYKQKALRALDLFKQELQGVEYYIHKAEGAFFLWLWFPGLPVSCEELYKRLKDRGVLIIPGHYFFPGLDDDWTHKHECIRVSYAMHDSIVEQGIRVIVDEVKKACRNC